MGFVSMTAMPKIMHMHYQTLPRHVLDTSLSLAVSPDGNRLSAAGELQPHVPLRDESPDMSHVHVHVR